MPARKDFAIIHRRAFSDPRISRMGDAMAEAGMASGDASHLTAIGAIAALSCWLIRNGDSGTLPGDGVLAVREATALPRKDAESLVAIMLSPPVGLLRKCRDGLYLRGFKDSYAPLIEKRRRDVGATSARRRRDVETVSERGRYPTVAVAVTEAVTEAVAETESKSKEEASPLTPLAEQSEAPSIDANDNGPPREHGPHLAPAVHFRLRAEGVNLRDRPGKWWEWQKGVTAAIAAGYDVSEVIRALRDPRHALLQPWQFFDPATARTRFRPPGSHPVYAIDVAARDAARKAAAHGPAVE